MHQKIQDIIEKSENPLSTIEIAEKAGINMFETRKNLQRLSEEGKIESVEKKGKICWQKKEEDIGIARIEKRIQQG